MVNPSRTTLTFLGGAETVTGSKFLLTIGDRRILVDCGMFQGEKKWRARNWEEFPVDPASISDLILTHAHMDHSGYIPALVKNGFDGPIWCTEGTRRLAEIVLRDAGYLQEREAEDAAEGGYSKHDPPLPLYTIDDVLRTLPLFTSLEYDTDFDLGGGITIRLTRAGHILGSASVTVTTPETQALFSGDIGRHDHPVLRPRDTPPGSPYVLVESTYGDREHPEPENLPHEGLADVVRRTIARGGSVLIPAFAIDRTSVVLTTLTQMMSAGRIPDVPIYVNSPMALSALDVYQSPALRDELRPELTEADFADPPNLREVRTADESKRITKPSQPAIVISSSGMLTGGRVLHHLEALLPGKENAVILTGYQGIGTRGRALAEGATELKMYGKYVPVRAEIYHDREFSVHADASDIIDWLRELEPRPQTVFCIHGEADSAAALARKIKAELGIAAVVPRYGEVVTLAPTSARPFAPLSETRAAPTVESEAAAAAEVAPAAAAVEPGAAATAARTPVAARAVPEPVETDSDGEYYETEPTLDGDVVWQNVATRGDEIVLEGRITIRLRR